MKQLKVKLIGDAPLIVQADTLADPLHPLKKKMEELTGQRKKTDETHMQIARIEMEGGLYYDARLGPYLPSENLFKCLVEAARLSKSGKQIERGTVMVEDKLPLEYDGPRDLQQILDAPQFRYRKPVVVAKSKTIRVRPIFKDWSCTATIAYEEEIVNEKTIKDALVMAGRFIGLGNRRPNKGGSFGRFTVEAQA